VVQGPVVFTVGGSHPEGMNAMNAVFVDPGQLHWPKKPQSVAKTVNNPAIAPMTLNAILPLRRSAMIFFLARDAFDRPCAFGFAIDKATANEFEVE
jgi:hypothetical protein